MKRFIKVFALFVLGCMIAAFAVANRHPVRFVADPFISRDLALSFEAPFFVYLFIALFIGIIIGAAAAWVGQRHWRKTARAGRKEAAVWKREAENLKRGLQSASKSPTAAISAPRPLRSYL
jgi:uncharacterized integral membrane protein